MHTPRANLPALFGMPVAGLLWSLAVLQTKSEIVTTLGIPRAQALVIVSLGGVTQTLILWLGFTIVCWAMIRALSERISITQLGALVSRASFPLWVGAPALAYWISNTTGQAALYLLVTLVSVGLFLIFLARLLATQLGCHLLRAAVAVSATMVFLASSIFLSL